MRISRVLALAGLGSRRACEKYVLSGKALLNGKAVFDLGRQVDLEKDKLVFQGKEIHLQAPTYFMVNKPKGFVSTASDPHAKKTVFDLLPPKMLNKRAVDSAVRVFMVGRLDKESTGLLLFTNQGELANKLTHPKYGIEKWYEVKIDRPFQPEDEPKLIKGIWLSDGRSKIDKLQPVTETLLKVMLTEGKKREVRRLFAKLDYKVKSLHRVSFGPLQLKTLPLGAGRFLTSKEVESLKKSVA